MFRYSFHPTGVQHDVKDVGRSASASMTPKTWQQETCVQSQYGAGRLQWPTLLNHLKCMTPLQRLASPDYENKNPVPTVWTITANKTITPPSHASGGYTLNVYGAGYSETWARGCQRQLKSLQEALCSQADAAL
eukprot:4603949-Amphidinium_carterae.1